MASRISERNYAEMINALCVFAKNISEQSDDMLVTAYTCTQALGDSDEASGQILGKIQVCQQKYGEAAAMAIDIAKAMQEELEKQRSERQIWQNDD